MAFMSAPTASVFSPPLPASASGRLHWHGLQSCSRPLAIAQAAVRRPGLTLVVCEDGARSVQLEEELRFFCTNLDLKVWHLPDWETLPYDSFSPHQDIVSDRLSTLHELHGDTGQRQGVLVVPISALMQCTTSPDYLRQHSLVLQQGQQLIADSFRTALVDAGYSRVDTVYEHGEFAIRGSIVDLFPMGSDAAVRIELFDDEIESLRYFDTESQRTTERVTDISLLPAKEFPLDAAAIAHFRQRWHAEFSVNHSSCPVYQDISAGLASAGIEYYLPLFFDRRYSLLDHLPADVLLISEENAHEAAEKFWLEVSNRFDEYGVDPTRPLLPPEQVFLRVEELFAELKTFPQVILANDYQKDAGKGVPFDVSVWPNLEIDRRAEQSLHRLDDALMANAESEQSMRILFSAESAGRLNTLEGNLSALGIQPQALESWQAFLDSDLPYASVVSPLLDGCQLPDLGLAIICEDQLAGEQVRNTAKRDPERVVNPDLLIKNLTELQLNAPVVHIDHGVGRYRGLIILEIDGQAAEFLHLDYAEEARLYVPVSSLHLINRYLGSEEENAPLHRLGSEQWQKARKKAAQQVADVAAELLLLNAKRAARPGFVFKDPGDDYRRFADSFAFEETPDQANAISAVLADMFSEQPMDRLVCGDVGFGKTEVALRAAFVAVQSGKQVAILVPTTLLAQQHYETFNDRFADWPINVGVLSRFKSAKEQSERIAALKDGKLDVVIGTHKLLQKDIKYKSLGLLVIDEEHRFGVKQKEALKALRSEVDILTLTATPIPRTLNMAMSGLRDLSIIASPPAKRLSINTFVREYHEPIVREAILREILRGGQVYFLHNEVKSIEKTVEDITKLVPEARCAVAHGQMPERELERVMSDFYHRRFNVLVCTTIIETGIDVPTANTIIIERADKFGLAQLHQLRGRVGRSHHQAYAYLFTPHPKSMSRDAHKRLEAIEQAGDLGAGFTLATHDLEIRGAGELLGDEQSGQIQSVGFTLYMDMLERAVQALQNGEEIDLETSVEPGGEINMHVPALIPDNYLPDVHSRLILYKRISSIADDSELIALREEMIDRFGPLPEQIQNLFRIAALRMQTTAIGIAKLDCGARGGRLEFAANTQIDPMVLVTLVQQKSLTYRMDGANALKFSEQLEQGEERFTFVNQLLALFTPPASPEC